MKKKLFAVLIAAVLLCACLPCGAVTAAEEKKTYGPLTYRVCEDEVWITDCADDAVEVLIPLEIEGKFVTLIYAGAFVGCDQLTSLTFFNQLVSIDADAFIGCTALTEVHYRGTEEEHNAMMVWYDGNGAILRAAWYHELPGDADGNGKVNNRDLGALQQYLNGYDVTIETALVDINGDGKVNNRDLGSLQRRLNGDVVDPEPPFYNDGEFWGWEQQGPQAGG